LALNAGNTTQGLQRGVQGCLGSALSAVRQSQTGSRTRPEVLNTPVVIDTKNRAVSALHQEIGTFQKLQVVSLQNFAGIHGRREFQTTRFF
jgi:hypothetical protein